jgi:NADH dehydrogenase
MLSDITGRSPVPLHVPKPLAAFATSVAESAGLPFPIDDAKLKMLVEHNVIEPPEANALTTVFGVTPTPIKDGLTRLADLQPEQQPADGVGALECKRFWADIHDSDLDAERLMSYVREHCTDLMPVEFAVEPGSEAPVEKGETLTGAIPMRGNIQVRVVEVTPMSFTFATLRGHPLAGVVKFESADIENGEVRFGVTIWARAATFFDWLAMKTVGRGMQDDNWKGLVERVVVASGGMAESVHSTTDVCDDATAARIEGELSELIADQKRETALHAAD